MLTYNFVPFRTLPLITSPRVGTFAIVHYQVTYGEIFLNVACFFMTFLHTVQIFRSRCSLESSSIKLSCVSHETVLGNCICCPQQGYLTYIGDIGIIKWNCVLNCFITQDFPRHQLPSRLIFFFFFVISEIKL